MKHSFLFTALMFVAASLTAQTKVLQPVYFDDPTSPEYDRSEP